jgi:hypothetical protein
MCVLCVCGSSAISVFLLHKQTTLFSRYTLHLSSLQFYDITEVPVFIKAGSVIPRLPLPSGNVVGKAMDMYEVLMFDIFSGREKTLVCVCVCV